MTRIVCLALLLALGACNIPVYDPEPVSIDQWQRRQEAIQRQQAERERLCAITKQDDPRHDELCRGLGARH